MAIGPPYAAPRATSPLFNGFAAWAQAVGVPCGPPDALVKEDPLHELDAVVAYFCGLIERQLGHIFETFREGWDHADRLEATLKHFHARGRKGK